jgi:hypothetical protein
MKKLGLILLLAFLFICATTDKITDEKFNRETCTCKGRKLYGRVRIVDFNPDFRVKVVEGGEDLRVCVRETASRCGEWNFTAGYADFTVQFVEYTPDFTIRFVDY